MLVLASTALCIVAALLGSGVLSGGSGYVMERSIRPAAVLGVTGGMLLVFALAFVLTPIPGVTRP